VLRAAGLDALQEGLELRRVLRAELGLLLREGGEALLVELGALAPLELVRDGLDARGLAVLLLPENKREGLRVGGGKGR
jgi:hypothetical protein